MLQSGKDVTFISLDLESGEAVAGGDSDGYFPGGSGSQAVFDRPA